MVKKEVIGLLYGGPSEERTVSMKSAYSILENVDYSRYSVLPVFIDQNNSCHPQKSLNSAPETEIDICNLEATITFFELSGLVDVIFPVTHGPIGEDGHYQAVFELLKIPYVGCNLLTSSISMDKGILKDLCATYGISQTPYYTLTAFDYNSIITNEREFSEVQFLKTLESELSFPMFIKPANLGSSVGISKARNINELRSAILLAFKYDQKIIIEKFVEAREIEVGVLGNCPYEISKIGEITTNADFYDFDAKYLSTEANKIIIPAVLPKNVESIVEEITLSIAKAINIRGLSRIDFFYDEKNNQVFLNEINTLPGFTKHSMYPMLFEAAGISYTNLITKLIEFAQDQPR